MNSARYSTLLLLAALGGPAAARADETYGRHQFDEGEREHWSYQTVARPDVPAVSDAGWVSNEIDAFILARLERKGLRPAPPADRRTLLRRVYLDLIGLPPTPEEMAAFLADESPEAYARAVDDLLSRPQYGERWGRHWLDVVRYAESNGYERDNPKPHAWRYRDYVIEAFNRDKPYDRFVLEQLAGDELDGANAETHIAATFLRLGPWDDEPADPLVDRYDQLDDVLAGTSATFLALTIRCARCHDHKFECFKQKDYTRLLAVFEPLVRPQNDRDDLDRVVGTAEELAAYEQATAAPNAQVQEIERQIAGLQREVLLRQVSAESGELSAEILAALQIEPDARDEDQTKLLAKSADKLREVFGKLAAPEENERLVELRVQIDQVNATRPPEPPRAYIWREDGPVGPVSHLFQRGNPSLPAEEVAAGFPAILVDVPPPPSTPTARTTGRRRQLAEWLVRPEHPLTARVMVNRIWQHHFGNGIVGTENDFGVMGAAPTHPELLDWLAADFIAGGWKIKRMHRQILLSSTYRMSSQPNEAAEAVDPSCDLLWRFPPRRLEAEAIRDLVLAASGQLNLQAGGPSVFPKISESVLAGQSRPGSGWTVSEPAQAARRSVYVFVKRTLLVPELELLDLPSSNETCEQRNVSTVAPQALTYLNGAFIHEQAAKFAERLLAEAGADPAAQVERAFLLTVCRPPTAAERAAVLEFLTAQRGQIVADAAAAGREEPDTDRKALASLCLVLLNGNEFVYLQ